MTIKMDGNRCAKEFRQNIAASIQRDCVKPPKLLIITVGDDDASKVYVRNKIKAAEEVGIDARQWKITVEDYSDPQFWSHLDGRIQCMDGVILQLPVPQWCDAAQILQHIPEEKDVDGLTTTNIGNLFDGKNAFTPCTALGVMELFKRYDISLQGKHAVILGRSKLVGKPLIACLLNENATVTICHSKTENLNEITNQADILIVAIGKKYFVKEDMVKTGSIVIDVGINVEDGKIYGDVDFESVKDKVSYLTPVPNGVGRMTVISLMKNVIKAYLEQSK
jgi:methylenetetrahydrofolate dehydrogenase (NADP+)/methenyltetrahydrofolate cyclohydrolase